MVPVAINSRDQLRVFMAVKAPIDSLTGLRGVAALLVVTNHFFVWCSPYQWTSVPMEIRWLFATSDYGMTLFFTLSGFVITYNYFDFGWKSTPIRSTVRFAYLRFSRLYPALLLFIVLAVNSQPPSAIEREHFTSSTLLHVLSAQAWMPSKFGGAL